MPSLNQKNPSQPEATSKSARVRTLLATGMSAADIAKKVGCTPNLVYVIKAHAKAGKRGPGRPRKVATSSSPKIDGLAGILDAVQNSERQRVQLREALEKIQAVLVNALA